MNIKFSRPFELFLAETKLGRNNVHYDKQVEITCMNDLLTAVEYDNVESKYKNNYRSKKTFEHTCSITIDVDNEHTDNASEWITPKKLNGIFRRVELPIVYSKNHDKEKVKPNGERISPRPRFHAYFTLKVRINSYNHKQAIKIILAEICPAIDRGAISAAQCCFSVCPNGEKASGEYFKGDLDIIEWLKLNGYEDRINAEIKALDGQSEAKPAEIEVKRNSNDFLVSKPAEIEVKRNSNDLLVGKPAEISDLVEIPDADIIELIELSAHKTLFNGEPETIARLKSTSEADFTLCKVIANFTLSESQIDRIFRSSGLMPHTKAAQKWDQITTSTGATYGELTIENALKSLINGNEGVIYYESATGLKNLYLKALDADYGEYINYYKAVKSRAGAKAIFFGFTYDNSVKIWRLASKRREAKKIKSSLSRQNEIDQSFLAGKDYFIIGSKNRETIYRYFDDLGIWRAQEVAEIEGEARRFFENDITDKELTALIRHLIADNHAGSGYDPNFNKANAINFLNGVLDFDKNELVKHDKSYYFSTVLPYEYNKNADCPKFRKFFEHDFLGNDTERINAGRDMLGYLLYPDQSLQACFFLYGRGGNGKSVFCDLLKHTLGGKKGLHTNIYGVTNIKIQLLPVPHEAALLVDSIINVMPDCAPYLNSAVCHVLKAITGGDPLHACEKYKAPFDSETRAKLVFGFNHFPIFADISEGLKDRPIFFHLTHNFRHDLSCNPHLPDELKQEQQGIFNYIYECFVDLRKRGYIRKCKKDQEAMMAMAEKLSDNVVAQWYYDELQELSGQAILARDIYNKFMTWHSETKQRQGISKNSLYYELENTLGVERKRTKAGNIFIFKGSMPEQISDEERLISVASVLLSGKSVEHLESMYSVNNFKLPQLIAELDKLTESKENIEAVKKSLNAGVLDDGY